MSIHNLAVDGNLRAHKSSSNLILNPGQKAATEEILSAALNGERGRVLKGEGGTGKTTCVMWLADQLTAAGLSVLFCAPTNKAVKQLEKSAREYGLDLDLVSFSTVHSALGLALLPNEENKYAHQIGKEVISSFDVVICDEASMLSRRVLQDYLEPASQLGHSPTFMLYMGDGFQLPPVREKESLAFSLFPDHELTKVERQSENSGILKITAPLRESIGSGKRVKISVDDNHDVQLVKAAKFAGEIVNSFDKDTDIENVRVISWTNARCDEINRKVREKLYGKNAQVFEIGERIVTAAPVQEEGNILLGTDEECHVELLTDSEIHDPDGGEFYKTLMVGLRPIYADTKQLLVHTIHPDEEFKYSERLSYLAGRAKKCTNKNDARMWWARFHKFKELFAQLKYCYCITVHRSQGSTYDKVFVDVENIMKNRDSVEKKKLLYVAFSRPRHTLVVNKREIVV